MKTKMHKKLNTKKIVSIALASGLLVGGLAAAAVAATSQAAPVNSADNVVTPVANDALTEISTTVNATLSYVQFNKGAAGDLAGKTLLSLKPGKAFHSTYGQRPTASLTGYTFQYWTETNWVIGGATPTQYPETAVPVGTVQLYPYFTPIQATSIIVSGADEVPAGSDSTYSATVIPEQAADDVTWSVSPSNVATINATTGVLHGVSGGEATITATANDGSGVTGTKLVKIVPSAPASMTINMHDVTQLAVDETITPAITATIAPATATQKVIWSAIGDPEASKDARGAVEINSTTDNSLTITGAKVGLVRITATAIDPNKDGDPVTAYTTITVVDADVEDVEIVGPNSLDLHDSGKFMAKVSPSSAAQSVTWESSDTAVATIDTDGTVTPVAEGTVTITATSTQETAKSASQTLIITDWLSYGYSSVDTDGSTGKKTYWYYDYTTIENFADDIVRYNWQTLESETLTRATFNEKIIIGSKVSTIGDNFLFNCPAYNQPLTIPASVKYIGADFLTFCTSFNGGTGAEHATLTIQSSVTYVGEGFLNSCNALTSLVINADATRFQTSDETCATDNESAAMIVTGVTVTGSQASQFMARFPNPEGTPEFNFRNLKPAV